MIFSRRKADKALIVTPTSALMCAMTHHDLMAVKHRMSEAITAVLLGANVADRLNSAVKEGRKMQATHLVSFEADMRSLDDAIIAKLIARRVHIIGANYRHRQQPGWTTLALDGQPLTSRGKTGIEKVLRIGCGVMVIDLVVFDAIPKPWFSQPYDPTTDLHQPTPDYYFCAKAIDNGEHVYVDHDASQSVRHIGSVEFGVDDAYYTESQQPVRLV